MKKIWPNDLCPCGSGKKFKKCWWMDVFQNECINFLQNNKQKRIEKIQRHIDWRTKEVSTIILELNQVSKQRLENTTLYEFIIIFSFWGTIAYIRNLFNNYNNWDKQSFLSFYNAFCNTKLGNQIYKEHPELTEFSWEMLYWIRSDLVHFLAIKDDYGGKTIGLQNSPVTPEPIRLKAKKLKLSLLNPIALNKLFIRGTLLMLDEINAAESIDEKQFLLWIKRIGIELEKRSIEIVTKEKTPKVFI